LAATITVVDEASERALTGHCMLERSKSGRRGVSHDILTLLANRAMNC
jgi:hypothetical protein